MGLLGAIVLIATQYSCSPGLRKGKLRQIFKHSAIVNDHFTGFALYDMDAQKMVYQLNADKYFTPASNTKLYTFYTCLKMLSDSIPALKYVNRNDSLIFWATGDPSFLHTDLKGVNAFNLLKNSPAKLYFSSGSYTGDFYGNGWPYGDYNDYYQAEINELPVEDNVAVVYADADGTLKIKPTYLQPLLKCDSTLKLNVFRVQRNILNNDFVYPAMRIPKRYRAEIPWKVSTALQLALLKDTLKREITEVNLPMPTAARTIYNAQADTVYRRMLQPSDNFIAEQLLLVCSSTRFKTLSPDSVINYSINHYLNDLPDKPQWVDGSGLSRKDLFTPRDMIALLQKIAAEVKDENLLHSLMPAGGVVGTIKNAYKTDNGKAFVWAKTGSLANNHNQSGYLVTRKGKRLAFAFMNNNFTRPTREIRDEMVRIITYIHENY
ncbi:D-alanyl-D-alanine carboxypeptidase/D-alanyl-D-alanine-endopeptidase (penicillin-binding protein 4) [Mucilaginibacter gracilis]|uniref:D-alanyl-D-alanine carboxypeptidase/D-alanyl-D-alanine-endopeptidase (Penicillin-binding protein 4) n=2 Tax=Mucilaginibacter gracilis TaxID=423350 RepID=A0A495IX38_9SPHI|nr:D-alanyl-D-alanine carboxypeptidase/D-alanyl-D-alanine-endopeptidase (penicillin-binding protein 4) [Mucilaginibacter gracilis]